MIDAEQIAADFGTPAYVYDLAAVRRAVRDLRACLPSGVDIYYSLKANPHPALVSALAAEGCAAEITSTGELTAVLEAGVPGARCVYTGPGKSRSAISAAIGGGVRCFSAESTTDLHRIDSVAAEAGQHVDCLIRYNGAPVGGGQGMRMTGTASQFGVDVAAAAELMDAAASSPNIRLRGPHFFPATNIAREADLLGELAGGIRTAAELRGRGHRVELLDIGGGFGAPYAKPGHRPSYPGLRAGLSSVLDECFPRWRGGSPRVAVESGRFLVADCGVLVTRVLDVKSTHGRTYAVLDAGINHLGGLSGLGRVLPLFAEPSRSRPSRSSPPTSRPPTSAESATAVPMSLAGPLCTAADIVGRDVTLPGVAPGDLLEIPNVGAYGLTASLIAFLGHPAPVEVIVEGTDVVSASRLVQHREPIITPPGAGPADRRAPGPSPTREPAR